MSTEVDIAVNGDVATLTLNAPEKRNSVTHDMWRAIGDSVEALAKNSKVRVLIVRLLCCCLLHSWRAFRR